MESDGQTPWEGAQVATLEVLLEICQDYGDELVNGLAGSFPRVSVTDTFVSQIGTEPLEMRETILGYSSSPAMSAMLAVLNLYYVRQDTYIEAMLALQQAQVGQCKLCKRVRKHRKAFSDAQAKIQFSGFSLPSYFLSFSSLKLRGHTTWRRCEENCLRPRGPCAASYSMRHTFSCTTRSVMRLLMRSWTSLGEMLYRRSWSWFTF